MNQAKHNAVLSFFESKLSDCSAEISALNADHRADEAVFMKVRMNVYDIFRTVFSACAKFTGEDDQKLVQSFLTKLRQIPQNWHSSLAVAEQHGDLEKAHIERIKLDTATEISEIFIRIWEENP